MCQLGSALLCTLLITHNRILSLEPRTRAGKHTGRSSYTLLDAAPVGNSYVDNKEDFDGQVQARKQERKTSKICGS